MNFAVALQIGPHNTGKISSLSPVAEADPIQAWRDPCELMNNDGFS